MTFWIHRAALLAGAAFFVSTAFAQAGARNDDASSSRAADQAKLQQLQEQIDELSDQVSDLKRSTSNQYTDVENQRAGDVKVSLNNGQPTFATSDGQFTAAIRVLAQLDWAYYSQGKKAFALPGAYAPDLSSGTNFRRVYLGVQGKLFGDWSYNANFDFGGSGGTEAPGHVQSVYLEYDGLAPFAIRAGAYPAPSNIEDGTASGDTIFLERNASSDLQRNIAGGDGRDAISLLYLDDRAFGALSYTGNKVQETGSVFGEQQAFLGRASWLVINDTDAHWLIGANGTHVTHPQGTFARNTAFPSTSLANGTARTTFTLSDPPELTVDENSLKLANTTALSAKYVTQWGVETAGNWGSLYGQAGYYGFDVDRAAENFTVFTASATSHAAKVQPLSDHFSGWYAQFAWTFTGEERKYNKLTGAFTPPQPAEPFDLNGNWGAWEIAGRYSDLDLNDRTLDASNVVTGWSGTSKTFTYYNTVRGGDQRIWTAALNWYPINDVKLALQYQYIQLSRLQSGSTPSSLVVAGPTTGTPVLPTASASQNLQTIALRVQFQL
jgi:phosphate-selective porin OprO/OprP